MNLLLIELDGLDCIVDHNLRLKDVKQVKRPPIPSTYLRRLYDITLLALDEPVQGTREYMDYLIEQKWRLVILTHRIRTREVYHATVDWLKEHGFDDFSYELVLKEPQNVHMSVAEWKVMKTWWYTQESLVGYKSIVLLDPNPQMREKVQERWNAFADRPLLTYSSLTEFSIHQLLFEQDRNRRYREEQRILIKRWDRKGTSLQATAMPAETMGEVVQCDTQEPGDVLSTSILPVAGEPTRSDVKPSSYSPSDTGEDVGESGYEQDHGVLELLEESPQLEMEVDTVEEVQHSPFFEDVIQMSYDDDCDAASIEPEIESEDEEGQQRYEPLRSHQRGAKSRHLESVQDERYVGKKRTKRIQRERQAVRSVKEAVLMSGSEEE